MAVGSENLADYLVQVDEIVPIPEAFFNLLAEKLKMYYITGGPADRNSIIMSIINHIEKSAQVIN